MTGLATRVPVDSFTDWLDQEVRVGDDVIVVVRVGDVARCYSAEVLEIASITPHYGNAEVKAKVQPTGKYSGSYAHHYWQTEQDVFTSKTIRVGRPRGQWVMTKNISKTHVKVLDNGN